MDKPSKADFLKAARVIRAFCEQRQDFSCRDCPAAEDNIICSIAYPMAWYFCKLYENDAKADAIEAATVEDLKKARWYLDRLLKKEL